MRVFPAPRSRVFWALKISLVAVILLAGCSSSPINNNSTAPTISSLTPNSGAVGTPVTIAGTNFGASQGTSTVTFNGTSAGTASSWSATSITINVPAGATSGNVVVTVGGGASNGASFTVPVPPSITQVNPNQAPVGASVTITGTNFGASQGTSTVTFNGTSAGTASVWSATSITVTVPNAASTGNVVVTVGGLASSGVAFTVLPSPSITSLSSASGSIGSSLTITGTNFGASQGSSTVTFNGTSAGTATAWSATSITVNVPSGATSGNIVVTVSGGASNGVAFTVAPFITSLSRTSGAAGTAVTITGLNFGATQGASTVAFNGTTATASAWSATSISVTVPSGATTGTVVVTVGALSSNGVSFTVVIPPSITSLSVTHGSVGDSVTITGTAFGASQGSSTVTFNGTSAGTAGTWSDTSITVTVPSGATTGPVVVVVNSASSNGISFTVAPVISSLNPTSGGVTSSVTISGSNFGASQGTSTVTFNSIPATASAWSNTSITATVPTGATTGNVVVTVGGLASNGVNFTVTVAPIISSLTPNVGSVTSSVTVSGTNFGASQGTSTVTFNGTSAGTASSWSATSITVAVPAGATIGNVVVTVGGVASNGIPFDVTSSCPLTAGGSESLLNGGYVLSFDGFDDLQGSPAGTNPFQITGVFTADGSGHITGGERDFGSAYGGTFTENTITGGCYSVGADQRGYMIWNISGATVRFAISVRADGSLGHVIRFEDFNPGTNPSARGEGTFKKQTLTTFSASNFSGNYAFGFTGASNDSNGTTANYERMAVIGVLNAGGSALTISNAVIDVAQVNNNTLANVDDVPEAASGSGFTAPDSFGRGTLTLAVTSSNLGCSSTCAATFSYYMVSPSDIFLQGLGGNNNPMWNGEALSQTGTFGSASALSGTAVLSATGEDITNHNYTVIALGQVSGNGSGSVSAFLDKVSNGAVKNTGTTQITGGAFSVSANGLGSFTIGSGGSAQPFSVAMVTQNTGFVLEGTQASPAVNIMTGMLTPQTVTTTLSSAHSFALGAGEPADTNATVQVGSLSVAAPNFTGTADDSGGLNCSTGCLAADQAIGGTYSIDSNGRLSITVTGGGGGSAVGWALDSTDFEAFSADTNADLFIFNQ